MSVADHQREFRRDFGTVSGRVLMDPQISTTAKAVYAVLAVRADPDGECFPSNGMIARGLDVSKRTVMRCLDELAAHEVVVREPRFRDGRQTSSITRLIDAYSHEPRG